jgi:hypothetical protein
MQTKKSDVSADLCFLHVTEQIPENSNFYVNVSDEFMMGCSVRIIMDAGGLSIKPWRDSYESGITEEPTPSEIARMLENAATQRAIFRALHYDKGKTLDYLARASEHLQESITPLLSFDVHNLTKNKATTAQESATVISLFGNREPAPRQPSGTAPNMLAGLAPAP